MMVAVWWMAKRQGLPVEASFSARAVATAAGRAGWALLMPLIIVGGILLGIFTVTEAAVVSVVYGFIIAKFVYRELGWSDVYEFWSTAAQRPAPSCWLSGWPGSSPGCSRANRFRCR